MTNPGKTDMALPDMAEHAAGDQPGRRAVLKQAGWLGLLGVMGGVRAAANEVVRIGYIGPASGAFSLFSEADDFIHDALRGVLAKGLQIGGRHYQVEMLVRDDRSNPERARMLANQLIGQDKVDLMLVNGAVSAVNVAQHCELHGVPCISTMTPWQAWMFPLKGTPERGFKHVYHFFWGVEDIAAVYADIWQGSPSSKVVGAVWSNDLAGHAMGDARLGMPGIWGKAGYRIVDAGRFPIGAADFSRHIHSFKQEGVEIVTGLFNPPEWAAFWRQARQLGFRPKVATVAKAFLFPAGAQALGEQAHCMSTEIWWTPGYPFRSSLTGQGTVAFKDAYEAATGRTWSQPMGVVHALWELGIHALKTSGQPKDPAAVAAAIGMTSLQTIIGRISWADSPIRNVAKMRVVGGQWRLVPGKAAPQLFITNNSTAPEIPLQRKFELLRA